MALLIFLGAVATRAQAQPRPSFTSVRGVVYDSVRGGPLRDALVTIVGRAQSTTTDARGRFRFDSVPAGERTFAVHHAVLDSLGFNGLSRRFTLSGSDAEVRVGIPSFNTLWRRVCGDTPAPSDSGIVYGTIRDARTGKPLSLATVVLAWSGFAIRDVRGPTNRRGRGKELVDRRWRSETSTEQNGGFVFCGAPMDSPMRLQASLGGESTGNIDLESLSLQVRRRDLSVAQVDAATSGPALHGTIVGEVNEAAGSPFIDARVILDDSVEVRTDFDGRFVIHNAPAGTRALDVRYVGAVPLTTSVDVPVGDTARVTLRMPKITMLATTTITSAERARMLREEYEERRIRYHSYIRDSVFVGGQHTMANALQGIPNVTVKRFGAGEFNVLMPDGHGGSCRSALRVDGVTIDDFSFLNAIPPSRVVAIETYPHAQTIPSEYERGGVRFECGLVSVWTKWAFRIP